MPQLPKKGCNRDNNGNRRSRSPDRDKFSAFMAGFLALAVLAIGLVLLSLR